jgi:manganese/zinc/iron transport system substrate-binding protein
MLNFLGCKPSFPTISSSQHLRVVATTGMIADMVRWIGRDEIQVLQLIGAGVDPHLYKPIRDDVVGILNAELVFYNGLLLEGRMSELLLQATSPRRTVIAMSDAIPENLFLGEPGSDALDPHLWMDVSMWAKASQSVEELLARKLPESAPEIHARGSEWRNRLEELDQRGHKAIRSIPVRQRVLITSHDAFQYFGRRYGLEVQGIQGMSTASEAGLNRIPELIDLIGSRSIPAVFHESSVAGKLIDALVEGARARGHQLHVGEELFSDSLGPQGSGAETYIGMMEHNFRTIAEALGGKWE